MKRPGLLDGLREVERLRRRLDAADYRVIAETAARGLPEAAGQRSTGRFLRHHLAIDGVEANARARAAAAVVAPRRLSTGEELAPAFVHVAAAQTTGLVSQRHALLIEKTIDALPDVAQAEHGGQVETELVETELVDSSHVEGDLTAEGTERLLTVLDVFAAPAPATDGVQDARTLWQRQHDGLVNALEATQRCADLPTHNGVSATIVLTMTTEQYVTGAGLATTGHGHPVPASKALGWSRGDTEILVVALNSLRAVTHYSHRHRIFTETQRRVMGLRDGGCTFPGCPAPPSRCQTDHIHRWEHGGTTTVTNGQLLCPYHHQHHQRLGWTPAMINELPHWIPPATHDPTRTPQRNTHHDTRPAA